MLRLDDRWVWDWWLADTGSEYHLFFLQAPRSLGDQHLRHRNATIGHAVSTDLRVWQISPDALVPGPPGAWDDRATWTGSTIEHEGTWYTLYTGTAVADGGSMERVGVATSPDLSTWTKHPSNPILEPDRRSYEVEDKEAWRETCWRDPWVLPDPDGDGFHALITARAPQGEPESRGVIGHAWSANLVDWEVRPPLTEPGEFGHLEVPQVEVVDGTPVLLFSCAVADIGAARRARRPTEQTGTFLARGDSLLGPWDISSAEVIPVPDLYSARIVRDRAGEWQVLGFYDGSAHDAFVGEISDPIPFKELDVISALPQEPLNG
jgi:beta-fructofuranosidase